ncbi:MAG: TetR/AcrR family transcriptional regulator [Elusimicrobiota bacterium]|jgi:AcrR family transcriptional regulator|nr:TetR/AcrR family transcriptional regulator [Elusimicrobiota bacterium]
MTRTSQNIDKQLIDLGRKTILEKGIGLISIRFMCEEAGINLGMFSYYFKNKRNFIQIIVQSLADDGQRYIEEIIRNNSDLNSVERIKKVLLMLMREMKENKFALDNVLKNIDLSDDFYFNLSKKFKKRWQDLFSAMIDECRKDETFCTDLDNMQIFSILIGTLHSYAQIILESEPEEFYIKIYNMLEFVINRIIVKNNKEEVR